MPRSTNSVYRVIWRGTQFGQVISNVMHFRTVLDDNTEISLTRFNEFLASANAWWVGTMMPNLHESYVMGSTGMVELAGFTVGEDEEQPPWEVVNLTFGAQGLNNDDLGTAGAQAGDPLPTTVAAVINMLTGLAGRRNRGRFKLGSLSEPDNASFGLMGAVTLDALQTDFTTLIDAGITSTTGGSQQMVPVVFSLRKLHDMLTTDKMRLASERITFAQVSQNWGQQRSRRQEFGGG